MKNANAGKQRKFLAAQVLCGLLLGAYLTAGYSMPAAWAVDSANVDASNVAGYTVQWGAAIGTGTIAASNNQLVTGGTVYSSVNAKLDKTCDSKTATCDIQKLSLFAVHKIQRLGI